ncbi:TPR repeat-containing thioredoxin TTL2 [Capsicum chinense]|nr:TPR repeat-containing thioredoxin TTL2 [Capsicum chinense]
MHGSEINLMSLPGDVRVMHGSEINLMSLPVCGPAYSTCGSPNRPKDCCDSRKSTARFIWCVYKLNGSVFVEVLGDLGSYCMSDIVRELLLCTLLSSLTLLAESLPVFLYSQLFEDARRHYFSQGFKPDQAELQMLQAVNETSSVGTESLMSNLQLFACRAEAHLKLHQLGDAEMCVIEAQKHELLAAARELNFFGMFFEAYILSVQAQIHMAFGSDSSNLILYCNRAACWYKLEEWEKSLDDCNHALHIQPYYTKALLRRDGSNFKLQRWAEDVRDYKVLRRELLRDNDVAASLFHAQAEWSELLCNSKIAIIHLGFCIIVPFFLIYFFVLTAIVLYYYSYVMLCSSCVTAVQHAYLALTLYMGKILQKFLNGGVDVPLPTALTHKKKKPEEIEAMRIKIKDLTKYCAKFAKFKALVKKHMLQVFEDGEDSESDD